MCLKGECEGLVDIIDVVDDVLYVSIGGVFTFNYLYLSFSPIFGVFYKLPLCVDSVTYFADKVWSVMFGFIYDVRLNVVGYRLGVVGDVRFIVLEFFV